MESIVEEAQRIDRSAGDDRRVAIDDAVVVFNGRKHVAGIVVACVVNVDRAAVTDDVVLASLFAQGVGLDGDVFCQRVALFQVEVIHALLSAVVGLCVIHHWAHGLHGLFRSVVEDGLHNESRVA